MSLDMRGVAFREAQEDSRNVQQRLNCLEQQVLDLSKRVEELEKNSRMDLESLKKITAILERIVK